MALLLSNLIDGITPGTGAILSMIICARFISVYKGAAFHVYAQSVPHADGAQAAL